MPSYKVEVLKKYDSRVVDLLVMSVMESPYKHIEVDANLLAYHVQAWLTEPEMGVIIVLYADDEPVGVLVTRQSNVLFSSVVVAQEVMWYVKKEHRGNASLEMLALFEQWAQWIDAKVLAVSTLNNKMASKLGKFYEKHGFNKSETSYYKVLK